MGGNMSSKSKPGIGFKTSASEIQDKFQIILEKTQIEKSDLNELLKILNPEIKRMQSLLKEQIESNPSDVGKLQVLHFNFGYADRLIIERMIGILGLKLCELHEDIVKLEKSINELRLQTK